jgi:uncharacterized PurR-regulated membrane protein YhhQ (DUF165 family)
MINEIIDYFYIFEYVCFLLFLIYSNIKYRFDIELYGLYLTMGTNLLVSSTVTMRDILALTCVWLIALSNLNK